AAIEENLDTVRTDRQHPIVARERLLIALQAGEDVSAIVYRLDIVGLGPQRRSDEIERLAMPSLLGSQHAEQVLRLEIIRLHAENLLVERFGLGQIAALMKSNSPVQQLRQVDGLLSGSHQPALPLSHSMRGSGRLP